jgi:uroporphyrinogen-III synthase
MLRDAGIEVVNLELTRTEVLGDLGGFENLISRLAEYDGVFFTSPVAAGVFTDHVEPRLKPTVYTLGRRATKVLIDAGFVVRTIAGANTAEDMLASFDDQEFAGKKLLFVRGERSMPTIPENLAGIAEVDEVAVYRTVEIEPPQELAGDIHQSLTSGRVKYACFFSPSAVEAFEKRFGSSVGVAAIGGTTAARARELGFRIDLVASRATNEVFAAELINRMKEQKIV